MQLRFVAARRFAMPHTRPILSRSCLTVALAFALAACGTQAPPKADTPSQEQRLFDLERRMERLEARPAVQPPYRTREEIQAHIKALEDERTKLRTDYLPQHPAIRDIDRRLEILNVQLRMLE
jgi:hypothetical protein